MPLSIVVDGANRNDLKLAGPTLIFMEVDLPTDPDIDVGLCLDKGYDCQEVRDLVSDFGLIGHLRTRGEEMQMKRELGHRARRWVIERLHSWMNRFRRILTRWDKRLDTYLAMLHFACGIITWRTNRHHLSK